MKIRELACSGEPGAIIETAPGLVNPEGCAARIGVI
ncbi:hypothetical protein PT2222_70234 [Paraburkholderia tropica]